MMLVRMFLGVPVAAALAIPSIIGVYGLSGIPATVNILSTTPYTATAKWTYSVLPLFIFMGMLLSQSGLTQKIYRATDRCSRGCPAAWLSAQPRPFGSESGDVF